MPDRIPKAPAPTQFDPRLQGTQPLPGTGFLNRRPTSVPTKAAKKPKPTTKLTGRANAMTRGKGKKTGLKRQGY